MKKVVFRVLGGKGIGYGHFFRCLSLAKAIKINDSSTKIIFIVNEELILQLQGLGFEVIVSEDFEANIKILESLKPNLVVFDSYLGNDDYLRNIKKISKLMLIDDNNDIYDSTIPDIIYNGNIHANKLGYPKVDGQIQFLGLEYLIMKEEYWDSKNFGSINKDGLLITTGGTDEYGIVLNLLDKVKYINIKIKIVIGPGYTDDYIRGIEDIKNENIELIYKPSSLMKYISSSKIVLTAGGSTIYEVLSQKSVPIIFSIADNQDLICKELGEMGVKYIGKYPNIEYSRLPELIQILQYDKIDLNDKIFNLVNGDGAKLIVEILRSAI